MAQFETTQRKKACTNKSCTLEHTFQHLLDDFPEEIVDGEYIDVTAMVDVQQAPEVLQPAHALVVLHSQHEIQERFIILKKRL